MPRRLFFSLVCFIGAAFFMPASPASRAGWEEARIFIEYNSTDNDLGFHVALDAEEWRV